MASRKFGATPFVLKTGRGSVSAEAPTTDIPRLLRTPASRGTFENVAARTPGRAASRSWIRAWTAANCEGS